MKWIANYMFVEGKLLINHVASIAPDGHLEVKPASDELANTYFVDGALCFAHSNDLPKIQRAFNKAVDVNHFAKRYARLRLTPLLAIATNENTIHPLQLDFTTHHITPLPTL